MLLKIILDYTCIRRYELHQHRFLISTFILTSHQDTLILLVVNLVFSFFLKYVVYGLIKDLYNIFLY